MTRYSKKALRRPNWTFYDFSTAGGLTVANPALTVATGATITQNANGVRMQWTSANSGQQVGVRHNPSPVWDFSNTDVWGFEFDFSTDMTYAGLGGLRVIFASNTSGYTQYWSKLINTGTVKLGRRILWINKADFGAPAAGTPSWANIQRIEVFWQRSTRSTTVVPLDITFKGFYSGIRHQKATLIWTFDDDDASQYDEAWLGTSNPGHSLSAYGWPASFFVNTGSIGSGGKMTYANLRTLLDEGCGIYCHTHSHIANAWQYTPSIVGTTVTLANAASVAHGKSPGDAVTVQKMDPIEMNGTFSVATAADAYTLTYTCPAPEATTSLVGYNVLDHITQSALRAEIQQCTDGLVAQGFSSAGKHYAYPYGYHSDGVVSLLQSMGFKTARSLSSMSGSTQSYGWTGLGNSPLSLDWYRVPARSIGSTFSGSWTSEAVATILADVDAVIKYGGTLVLLAHNITNSMGATRDYSLTQFVALLDALKYRERVGLCQFMEWDSYYTKCLQDAA